jgi:CRISPR-associated protein Csx10
MGIQLTFNIKLESDYHVSAGYGEGSGIDSALLKDADGTPVLRGSTLAGILRDSLVTLLDSGLFHASIPARCHAAGGPPQPEYCGQYAAQGSDLCPVCRLFGNPADPKRWFISSARAIPLSHNRLPETQAVQRASISPRSRRAEHRKLFSQQDGSGELAFRFTITCPTADASAEDEAALWTALASFTRHLGRGRNRGQGEIFISLDQASGLPDALSQPGALLEHFRKTWLEASPQLPRRSLKPLPAVQMGSPDTELRFQVICKTEEPLLLAQRAQAGNQFDTRLSIPGQTLLGALAWQAAQQFALDPSSESYQVFVDTFLRQNILFTPLLPASYQNMHLYPSIPAPRDLVTCKIAPGWPSAQDESGYGHGVWWLSQNPSLTQCPVCGSTLEAVGGNLLLQPEAWKRNTFTYTPASSTEMHIRMDPSTQRVEPGALFGYTSIDRGEYFLGEIICTQAGWDALKMLTGIQAQQDFHLRLGKATRRGHGLVRMRLEPADPAPGLWQGIPLKQRMPAVGSELQLTLLTDTIICDPWGRFATGFSPSWIQAELGLEVEVLSGYASTVVVDGFNATHHVPRWRDIALAAGSTARLKVLGPATLPELASKERWGIGLRRGEGYGQIALNHPLYDAQLFDQLATSVRVTGEMIPKKVDTGASTREWKRLLQTTKGWEALRDPRFLAVSRWLYANQSQDPQVLAEQVKTLGKPDASLLGVIHEVGDRPFRSKFIDHQAGLDLLSKLLDKLQAQGQPAWQDGLRLLAEKVASEVDQAD